MSNSLAQQVEPTPLLDSELPEHKAQLERVQKRKRQSVKKQEFKLKIRKLKSVHRKRIQAIAKKHRNEQKLMQKRLKEQATKSKKDFERELVRTKKNYQFQLEHIRQVYYDQNMASQNELRSFFAGQLEEIKKSYGQMTAANSQIQLETLERWLKDEFLREMREKATQINKAEIEHARLNGQLQVGKLIQQLEERNLEVELLKQKVQQLERQVPQEHHDQGESQNIQEMVFGQQDESQKQELLSVIKEIAEEQHVMQDEASEDPEAKQPFWGRMKQKLFSEPSIT